MATAGADASVDDTKSSSTKSKVSFAHGTKRESIDDAEDERKPVIRDGLGQSGRPPKPTRPRYKEEKVRDTSLAEATAASMKASKQPERESRRPAKVNVFDFRVPPRVDNRLSDREIADSGTRKPPRHGHDSLGVALLSLRREPGQRAHDRIERQRLRDERRAERKRINHQEDDDEEKQPELSRLMTMMTNASSKVDEDDDEDLSDEEREIKKMRKDKEALLKRTEAWIAKNNARRAPSKSPFPPMVTCIGTSLASTTITKLHHPNRPKNIAFIPRALAPSQEQVVAAAAAKSRPSSGIKTADDVLAAAIADTAGFDADSSLLDDAETRKKQEEEEAQAKLIEEAKAAAEAAKAEQAAAQQAQDEDDDDSDEEYEGKMRRMPTVTEKQMIIRKKLFDFVQANKYKKVDEMFNEGVDVNMADEHGNTTLHIACQNGAKKLIKTALKHNANLNCQNRQGQTPMHYCFAYQYDKIASFLISKGADDMLVNEFGLTCYEGLKPSED